MINYIKLQRLIYSIQDYLFEKLNGFDLGGVISKEKLNLDGESQKHATAYQAVWNRNLREVFDEVEKTGISFDNFIDIGSGKGKACLYAFKRKFTPKITGLELSESLNLIAKKNSRNIKNSNIEFICGDALKFTLPNENCLIFLFNPFDAIVLKYFICNNIEHFMKYKSIIAYANDIHRFELSKLGFSTLHRNQDRKISLHEFIY